MGNRETAMVADYHNWKKGRSWFQKQLLKVCALSGIYCAGYIDGWNAAHELDESRKTFVQQSKAQNGPSFEDGV